MAFTASIEDGQFYFGTYQDSNTPWYNPTAADGSATWIGRTRAVTNELEHVEGAAQVEYSFADDTVSVTLDQFSNGRAAMAWSGLEMDDGEFYFSLPRPTYKFIIGRFHGEDHAGVTGAFAWDGLNGVFGATRK